MNWIKCLYHNAFESQLKLRYFLVFSSIIENMLLWINNSNKKTTSVWNNENCTLKLYYTHVYTCFSTECVYPSILYKFSSGLSKPPCIYNHINSILVLIEIWIEKAQSVYVSPLWVPGLGKLNALWLPLSYDMLRHIHPLTNCHII